jgi:pimeloyl-ACP methyl ester carboxylesterase
MFLVPLCIPSRISVFCFDFSGCGISGGEYISFGWYEREDVSAAIAYIQREFGILKFAIWGRSMGAAVSFFAIRDNPLIRAAVVDSPFRSLPALLRETLHQIAIPNCIRAAILWCLRRKIRKQAHFKIGDIVPEEIAKECEVPLFLIHADKDDVIDPEHSRKLFELYRGTEKEIRIVPGNHASRRPRQVITEAMAFLANALEVDVPLTHVAESIKVVEQLIRPFETRIKIIAASDFVD